MTSKRRIYLSQAEAATLAARHAKHAARDMARATAGHVAGTVSDQALAEVTDRWRMAVNAYNAIDPTWATWK